jgi:uncharacterized protein YukE
VISYNTSSQQGIAMTIHLTNLTEDQCAMLDVMWALDSEDDYLDWYAQLNKKEQLTADLLQRLVILETMDRVLEDCSEAQQVLKKFQLN